MKAFFVVLAVASLYGCGGSYGGTTAPPNQNTNTPPAAGGISVENNSFNPSAKTVAVGTTVQWAWNSCTGFVASIPMPYACSLPDTPTFTQ